MPNKLTESDIEDIKQKIENKVQMIDIAKEYGVHKTTLYHFIKKYNLPLHGNIKKEINLEEAKNMYLEQGISMEHIGNYFKVSERTISRIFRANNIPIRNSGQIYCYKTSYFEKVNSENEAYFLGLITSDGNLTTANNGNTHVVQINLQENDKIVLEIFANDIIQGGKSKPLSYLIKKENGKNQYKLSINNKQIYYNLQNLGLMERKSLIIKELCDKIPKELYHHYIRGLFDGDGSVFICKNGECKINYYSGSYDFVSSYKDYCCKNIKLTNNKIYKGSTFFVGWGRLIDIIKFYNFIYKDATVYIPRKYYKFLEIFKLKENTEEIISPKKLLPL